MHEDNRAAAVGLDQFLFRANVESNWRSGRCEISKAAIFLSHQLQIVLKTQELGCQKTRGSRLDKKLQHASAKERQTTFENAQWGKDKQIQPVCLLPLPSTVKRPADAGWTKRRNVHRLQLQLLRDI